MSAIDPTKAKSLAIFPHGATYYALSLDAAAKRLYAGSDDYSVYVVDPAAAKKEPLAKWTKHDNFVSASAFVVQGAKKFLVTGSFDRHLIWWNVDKGEELADRGGMPVGCAIWWRRRTARGSFPAATTCS